MTTLFKRNPTQAPSREENHIRTPHRIPACTHAHKQTRRDQCIYPKQSSHIGSHFRSCRSHGGGGSSTCRSIAFAAVWIHHLHLLLLSSLEVSEWLKHWKSPCLQIASFGNGCVSWSSPPVIAPFDIWSCVFIFGEECTCLNSLLRCVIPLLFFSSLSYSLVFF